MATELHWVHGPWAGRLALAARPRGGDWLRDEILGWKRSGIDTVCSLLTKEEERDLDVESGELHCLKMRPDGTILDGHPRIHVLRLRGENVDGLPREVQEQGPLD